MTQQELIINLGYLSNPIRDALIEVELSEKDRLKFVNEYAIHTHNFPLPLTSDSSPYYVYPSGTNKWGIEARAYFISNNNLPQSLSDILEPRRFQNRPGYDNWKRRISTKNFIYKLFEFGFTLGRPQNENRIRGLIPPVLINDFNYGYNL
jgi:hypothetical protein